METYEFSHMVANGKLFQQQTVVKYKKKWITQTYCV